MYKVKVERLCSCFIKSGFPEVEKYETQEEAEKEAELMLEKMNNSFCHKHQFFLHERFGDFTISMRS